MRRLPSSQDGFGQWGITQPMMRQPSFYGGGYGSPAFPAPYNPYVQGAYGGEAAAPMLMRDPRLMPGRPDSMGSGPRPLTPVSHSSWEALPHHRPVSPGVFGVQAGAAAAPAAPPPHPLSAPLHRPLASAPQVGGLGGGLGAAGVSVRASSPQPMLRVPSREPMGAVSPGLPPLVAPAMQSLAVLQRPLTPTMFHDSRDEDVESDDGEPAVTAGGEEEWLF
jgi:hypothetical protein